MRTCCFILLTCLFIELSACAQPGAIYFVDHDWTFRVGNARFGLFQDKLLGDEKYGAGRHTTLYFGNASVRFKTRHFNNGAGVLVIMIMMAGGSCFMIYKIRGAGSSGFRDEIRQDG